jgi:hypothetical protein
MARAGDVSSGDTQHLSQRHLELFASGSSSFFRASVAIGTLSPADPGIRPLYTLLTAVSG